MRVPKKRQEARIRILRYRTAIHNSIAQTWAEEGGSNQEIVMALLEVAHELQNNVIVGETSLEGE